MFSMGPWKVTCIASCDWGKRKSNSSNISYGFISNVMLDCGKKHNNPWSGPGNVIHISSSGFGKTGRKWLPVTGKTTSNSDSALGKITSTFCWLVCFPWITSRPGFNGGEISSSLIMSKAAALIREGTDWILVRVMVTKVEIVSLTLERKATTLARVTATDADTFSLSLATPSEPLPAGRRVSGSSSAIFSPTLWFTGKEAPGRR